MVTNINEVLRQHRVQYGDLPSKKQARSGWIQKLKRSSPKLQELMANQIVALNKTGTAFVQKEQR